MLQDESMVLVGGCATPNFRTTTEIRGSQGNCCDYSFLLGPRQELWKHNILLIFKCTVCKATGKLLRVCTVSPSFSMKVNILLGLLQLLRKKQAFSVLQNTVKRL